MLFPMVGCPRRKQFENLWALDLIGPQANLELFGHGLSTLMPDTPWHTTNNAGSRS